LKLIPKTDSLAFRLTIWYVVILGAIVVFAGTFLYQGYRKGLYSEFDEHLFEIAEDVDAFWQRRGVTWEEALSRAEARHKEDDPFLLAIELPEKGKTDKALTFHRAERVPDGALHFSPDLYLRADKRDWEHPLYLTRTEKALAKTAVRALLLPVRGNAIIQVGRSLDRINGELRRLALIMSLAGLLLLALASLGGIFIIRKALRPVGSVVEAAQRITADDLSMRIEHRGRRDEIGILVETFNDMIARLEGSIKKIKQFSGDVSHELRTPLTIIRGEIEVLQRKVRTPEEYRQTMDSVLEESARMNRIIDDLLFLSRLEALTGEDFDVQVPLDEVLIQAFESRELTARRKGLRLELRDPAPVRIRGEANLLERLIVNLIDNAIRYTPPDGRIEVSLETAREAAVLSVRDTGVGIPDEAIPQIFDRFFVVDKSRSKESGGSGLGLAIVKEVADVHGASIDVQSRVGEGTRFIVCFPLPPDHAAKQD